MTITATAPETYLRPRTVEDGHTHRCLAAAMIAAVENARDAEDMYQGEFRSLLASGEVLGWAEGYLADGTMTCTCGPVETRLPYAVGDTVRRLDGETGEVASIRTEDDGTTSVSVHMHVEENGRLVLGPGVLGVVAAFRRVTCCACDMDLNLLRGLHWIAPDASLAADYGVCPIGGGTHRPN
jgi:hypothetical protein